MDNEDDCRQVSTYEQAQARTSEKPRRRRAFSRYLSIIAFRQSRYACKTTIQKFPFQNLLHACRMTQAALDTCTHFLCVDTADGLSGWIPISDRAGILRHVATGMDLVRRPHPQRARGLARGEELGDAGALVEVDAIVAEPRSVRRHPVQHPRRLRWRRRNAARHPRLACGDQRARIMSGPALACMRPISSHAQHNRDS